MFSWIWRRPDPRRELTDDQKLRLKLNFDATPDGCVLLAKNDAEYAYLYELERQSRIRALQDANGDSKNRRSLSKEIESLGDKLTAEVTHRLQSDNAIWRKLNDLETTLEAEAAAAKSRQPRRKARAKS